MSIHSRIRQRRIECGYESQRALADALGVAWQTVQLWEKEEGGTAPNRSRIGKVAEKLGTTPEWLMTGRGEEGEPASSAPVLELGRPRLQWVSEDEAIVLIEYRRLAQSGKDSLLVVARALPSMDSLTVASQSLNLQWVSEDEAALLSEYRRMTESGKNSLLVMARALPSADNSSLADHKTK